MAVSEEFIKEISITDELRNGFGEYARYVIEDRALPDARDGLKPVHRRIIYAMNELGVTYRSKHKKCARIVGEVTGKYHPHAGGTYETLVRLGQTWSLRYPLVDAQGNFGSIDGFPPAAMRYTEARLSRIADTLLTDLSPKVVKYIDNFDGEETEPVVLPVRVPHLLLNGTKGIAVAMSSNIPPHNLTELLDACMAIIDRPSITISELTDIVKGPDFPTGGKIIGTKGIEELYSKGKGSLTVRSKVHVESPDTHKVRHTMLVVDEIPYFVNKASLVEEIAELINSDRLRGVSNVRDLSKKEIRIEVILEPGYEDEGSIKTIKAQLYKKTQLQTYFHARTLAFVYGKPRILNLKQALAVFLDFRDQIIKRRAEEELEKVLARLHVLEGLIIASNNIDAIIKMIRESESRRDAHDNLKKNYGLSDIQAKAVLDMTLARLAKVEQSELFNEAEDRRSRAEYLELVITNREERLKIMKEELEDVKNKYGDKRRTEILEFDEIGHKGERSLLHERSLLISSTSLGYVRTIDFDKFKVQGRGGVGVIGLPLSEGEKLLDLVIASNKDELLLITREGLVHKLPAFELIEVQKRTQKGRKLQSIIPVTSEVVKIVPVQHDGFTSDRILVTVTKKGIIKRTTLDKFGGIRKTGIKCLKFKSEDDKVADAFVTDGDSYIFIATKMGSAGLFEEKNASLTGRVAQGVIGLKLREGDEVISAFPISKEEFENISILTVTVKGYGKRTEATKYRVTNRGVFGVRNIKITKKNSYAVSALPVPISGDDTTISLLNSSGKLIKVSVDGIRIMGRSTQGVRVMRLPRGATLELASQIVDESGVDESEDSPELLEEEVDDETADELDDEVLDDDEDSEDEELDDSEDDDEDLEEEEPEDSDDDEGFE